MDRNSSGGDADNFDWDTEDELEIDNYAISSHSGVSPTNGEAVLGTTEVSSSADSPNSKLIDHFVGMGFSEELVAKAIEKNGEENSNLILEALLQYSVSYCICHVLMMLISCIYSDVRKFMHMLLAEFSLLNH